MNDVDRRQMDLLEQDAELLAAYQLDLLAQLERQLRAVHLTMRHIEGHEYRKSAFRDGFSR